jgi:tetratricopeptide (TPR) repeat protein
MAARAHAALKAINPPTRPAPPEDPQAASLAAPALAEGVVLQQRREQDKAVGAFDRAIAADPASADAYLLKCRSFPASADAYLLKCRSLAGLRRHEEAVAACTESLRLRPDQAEVLRDRGHYHLNLGQIEPGLADLQKAESLTTRDRGVYYHLGLAYYLNGDFTRAAQAYEACASHSADAAGKIECQAWLLPSLLRSGRRDDARELLRGIPSTAMEGHPGNYLDRLLLFKGAKTEAQVAATMAAEGAISEATVGYSLGIWHLLNGREARAREYFERSVASNYTTAWGCRASEAELKRLGRRPGATP